METLFQDLRFGARQLRRSPSFTAVAFTTIAVGIGLTTAVFSLVNALLFSPMPGVQDPDRLVAVYTSDGGGPGVSSYMDYVDFRDESTSFSELAAFKSRQVDVSTNEGTTRLRGLMVTENYFRTLGVAPVAGRFFTTDEDNVPGAEAVAVLSHAHWMSGFGGRRDVIGETLTLNRRAFTIVGVAPERFRGTNLADAPDVFVPMAMQPHLMPSSGLLLDRRGWGGIDVVGRLGTEVSAPQAQAEIGVIGARLIREFANTNAGREYTITTFRDATMPAGVREGIVGFGWILIVLALLVLLIACVNVANLLLTRGHARRREMAVRKTLGARKGRLVRQLLTEAALLATLGGAAGLLITVWANDLLAAMPFPLTLEFGIDRNVLLFGAFATILTGATFGLAPALGSARSQVVNGLKDSGRGPRSRRRVTVPDGLVVVQVALSVAVLAAAGLFGRTLLNLRLLDPGFDPEGVLTAELDPSLQGYDGERTKIFYRGVLEAVEPLRGVRTVAITSQLPGPDADGTSIRIQGFEPADGRRLALQFSMVSHDFFGAMRIPIRRGRSFREGDREGQPPVVLLNEAASTYLTDLTGMGALQTRISIQGPGGPFMEVVGIAADVRSGPPRQEPAPHMYMSWEQVPGEQSFAGMGLLVAGVGAPSDLAGPVRTAVASVDGTVPLMSVRSLDARLGDGVAQERLAAIVLGVAAALALFLASLGLYGVLAHAVTRRTSEIGVRMALGAARASVLRDVLARGLALTGIGLVIGLGLAALTGRALASLLYGVSAQDLTTLATVALVFVGVAFLASWVPARRATRIDPIIALRAD